MIKKMLFCAQLALVAAAIKLWLDPEPWMPTSVWLPIASVLLSTVIYFVLSEMQDSIEGAGVFVAATALWGLSVLIMPFLMWHTQHATIDFEKQLASAVVVAGVIAVLGAPWVWSAVRRNLLLYSIPLVIVIAGGIVGPAMGVVGSIVSGLWLHLVVARVTSSAIDMCAGTWILEPSTD